ncbi:MAG: FAD-dependent oxidoreductase [PVC group bacterium]
MRISAGFTSTIPPSWSPGTARRLDNPWPTWPRILRTTTSHEEGCERLWGAAARGFAGNGTRVTGVRCIRLDWTGPDGKAKEIPGSDFELPADLVVIAAGFTHPEHGPLIEELGLGLNGRGTIAVDDDFAAGTPAVFAAGDCVAGASLVVDAISQGRLCAGAIDRFIRQGSSPNQSPLSTAHCLSRHRDISSGAEVRP